MIRNFVCATAIAVLLAGPAHAQAPASPAAPAATAEKAPAPAATTPPAATPAAPETAATPSTPEACIEAAAMLGQAAEGKTYPEPTLEKLDQLFSKMEQLCDGSQYTEAMAVGKDIKSVLDGN